MRPHAGEAGGAEAAATGDGGAEAGSGASTVGATLGAGAGATLSVGAASSGFSPLQLETKPTKSAAGACHLDAKSLISAARIR